MERSDALWQFNIFFDVCLVSLRSQINAVSADVSRLSVCLDVTFLLTNTK